MEEEHRMYTRTLTRGQTQVLVEIRDNGGTLQEIADRIGNSKGYVASRLSEAYKRLDVAHLDIDERRAAAVRKAEKLRLLPAEFIPEVVDVPTGGLL
jgi:DNA-binding NarL/FixJ family response regulator